MIARISAMMFLEYWPMGVWAVTIGAYIGANTGDEGEGIYSAGFLGYSMAAGAIGSLVSPVLLGFVSDRYVSAQKLTSAMHFGCGLSVLGMYFSSNEIQFLLCLTAYFQFFVPTVALTNKIALRHLEDVDTEFPWVRIFATISWIGAGLFVGMFWPLVFGESIETTRVPLLIGAISNFLMAMYSITLPHTPPEHKYDLDGSTEEKTSIFSNRAFMFFLLISVLACMPSMAYTSYSNHYLNLEGYPLPAALLTLGQVSEVFCLWVMPWLLMRAGLKWIFIAGVLAWGIRYALLAMSFAFDQPWYTYGAIVIHGPCYVFVYISGQMYVDRLTDEKSRGAAQGYHALATGGLGHLLGSLMVGYSQEVLLTPEGVSPPPYRWTEFWMLPAVLCVLTAVLFKICFKPPRGSDFNQLEIRPDTIPPSPADALAEPHEL